MKLFTRNEKGQTLIEYALIIALVAIVVVVALKLLGPAISNTFTGIATQLP
jgi:pilus assembly protein Flp/PilA